MNYKVLVSEYDEEGVWKNVVKEHKAEVIVCTDAGDLILVNKNGNPIAGYACGQWSNFNGAESKVIG
jgi:hypothetical protein